jgi:hypothetical protein
VPALFTRMSRLPKRSIVSSTHRAAASSSTACATTPNALAPTCAAAASADSWDREVSTTLPPAVAMAWAVAKPMPLEAPVTIAVRPVRSKEFMSCHLWFGARAGRQLIAVLAQFLPGNGPLARLVGSVRKAQGAHLAFSIETPVQNRRGM